MKGIFFRFFIVSILCLSIVSSIQIYQQKPQDSVIQYSKPHAGPIQVAEDHSPPIFGYSWKDYQSYTIAFMITTAGSESLWSYTFSNAVYDESGLDTILFFYRIEPVDNRYSYDVNSWIKYSVVSYDNETHKCSVTLHFWPPIHNDWVYAYFWANDTSGNEAKGGLQGFCYSGIVPVVSEDVFLYILASSGLIGTTIIVAWIKRRR